LGKHQAKNWIPARAGMTVLLLAAAPAPAGDLAMPDTAQIAIILDDLGEMRSAGLRAIELPGPVACAFLPNTAHSAEQATLAHARGKEVLLHLPLQPSGPARHYPTALTVSAGRDELGAYFRRSLASVPYARGVNNHQGSLLTALPQQMDWLMAEVRLQSGLYFVDSRTSGSSVAYRAARAHGVPAAERNVFLDSTRGEAAVRAAFRQLVAKALRDERALAIGHPYPETFKVLQEELPKLAGYGIRLVAPSELIARQSGYRGPFKQLKLIPTLTLAAKTPAPPLRAATSAGAH
jgi:uncharacterized protein